MSERLKNKFSNRNLIEVVFAHETYDYCYYIGRNKSYIYLIIEYLEMDKKPTIKKVMRLL